MAAVLKIEESWAEVYRRMYGALQPHYEVPSEAFAGFNIPPLDV